MGYFSNNWHYKSLMIRHSLERHREELWRYIGFALFFTAVSAAIYVFLLKAFSFFYSFEVIGEFLVTKLLSTIFFIFFVFLVLSNINSIVKWFFTKEDLPFIVANPVSSREIFVTRGLEALFESSWAFLFFGIPVLLAYHAALGRLGAAVIVPCILLVPFVVIPQGIAFIIVMVLARILSPRVIRNTFSFLSLILMALLMVVLRTMQIEKLGRPESFTHLYEYVRFLAIPTHPLIPTSPFVEAFTRGTHGYDAATFVGIGFFVSTAAALAVVSFWINEFFYLRCYSNVRVSSKTVKRDVLSGLLFFLPGKAGKFILKEVRTIMRDPKEWSQVFIILALVVVYVYNFKLFPRDRSPLPTIFLESILAFLNMGLLSFVVAAISVRFIFPAFQSEGRPFWFILSSPVSMKELYMRKLGFYLPVILLLALALNYLSNLYITTPPFLYYLSYGYILCICAVAPTLSLYFGTRGVNFKETPNPYGGMRGISSMLVVLLYGGLVLLLLGWSSFGLVVSMHRNVPVPVWAEIRFAAASCAILISAILLVVHSVTGAMKNLKNIEL
jgi:ABC-2 type transport system permease protein